MKRVGMVLVFVWSLGFFGAIDGQASHLGGFKIAENNTGAVEEGRDSFSHKSTLTFQPSPNGDSKLPDIILSRTGTIENDEQLIVPADATDTYRFRDGEYQLIEE